MDWTQLLNEWQPPANQSTARQRQIWDRVAAEYGEEDIPRIDSDIFLQHLTEMACPDRSMRTLDVGCGAGGYSLALAPLVGEAVGVDISPRMSGYASRAAGKLALPNTVFHTMDWSAADIDALGFSQAFDIVFAHTTPAVCGLDTFDKLNRCSRKYCFYEVPARRTDLIQDGAFREAGLPVGEAGQGVLFAFSYLWCKGYEPALWYRKAVWKSRKSIEDMVAWCTDRAKLRCALTGEEERRMRAYIRTQAVDGTVEERTETTLVTIGWKVKS